MNRLRLLKQRVRRAGDVGIHKFKDGYVVATGRFQGDCTAPMSRRAAIQLAARWALPSGPRVLIVEQGNKVTKIVTTARGDSTVTESYL